MPPGERGCIFSDRCPQKFPEGVNARAGAGVAGSMPLPGGLRRQSPVAFVLWLRKEAMRRLMHAQSRHILERTGTGQQSGEDILRWRCPEARHRRDTVPGYES